MELIGNFDACAWANEFVARAKLNPDIPRDPYAMLGWFHGALLTGYYKGVAEQSWPGELFKCEDPNEDESAAQDGPEPSESVRCMRCDQEAIIRVSTSREDDAYPLCHDCVTRTVRNTVTIGSLVFSAV